jgi:hypothetical protein
MSTNLDQSTNLVRMAETLAPADLLPKHLRQRPADVFLTLQLGAELGLAPMQSIRSVHVIEGKPTMSADLMAALCMRDRSVCVYLRPVELSATVATYETQRVGWPEPMRMSFTWDDAQRAGLTGKDNWKKYPGAMLKSRCLSAIVRAAYPDLMLGIYDPDELDGVEPLKVDRVIDVTPSAPASTTTARKPLKDRIAPEPTPDHDVKVLRERLAGILADLGAAPSAFRAWVSEITDADIPPMAEWNGARLEWACKALTNGKRAQFLAWLAVPQMPPEPTGLNEDPRDREPVDQDELPL